MKWNEKKEINLLVIVIIPNYYHYYFLSSFLKHKCKTNRLFFALTFVKFITIIIIIIPNFSLNSSNDTRIFERNKK